MTDHYKTLGVSRTATQEEIKRAYRKLSKKYHPDANSGNQKAAEVFILVSQAYSVLSDEKKRAEYERQLSSSYSTSCGQNTDGNKKPASRASSNRSSASLRRGNSFFEDFFGYDPNVSSKTHNGDSSSSSKVNEDEDVIRPLNKQEAMEAIFGNRFKF